tara:strand:- start:4856 stop:5119 length:264 start_codon:yes stop_codon:yes gene_type:complete
MKHQITVKLEVEATIDVELEERHRHPLMQPNSDRRAARKLVRKLVDEGRIAADPTYNEHYFEDDPILPEWAKVKLSSAQYINSHIGQ